VSDGAKLLYGEITCLCNKDGYCWASNAYFSELYSKSGNTISRWISELARAGFIFPIVDNIKGNSRKIWLSDVVGIGKNAVTLSTKMVRGSTQKRRDPLTKNGEYNNKENNKKNNNNEYQKAVAAENENPSHVEERKEERSPSIPGGSPNGAPSASQPFRTYEPFDLYEQVEAIRTDYKMRENLTIVAKVPQPFFEPYLEAFKAKEEAIGCNHTSTREFRAHFINFCRARYKSESAKPSESSKPTYTPPQRLTEKPQAFYD